jgi:hypothetical protein
MHIKKSTVRKEEPRPLKTPRVKRPKVDGHLVLAQKIIKQYGGNLKRMELVLERMQDAEHEPEPLEHETFAESDSERSFRVGMNDLHADKLDTYRYALEIAIGIVARRKRK